MAFTISTIGIISTARPMAMPYSMGSTVVNSKAFAMKGISQTAVVRISDPMAAPIRSQFMDPSLKILPLWDLMFSEWNISAMDIVRKAMVVPSAELVISQVPVCM